MIGNMWFDTLQKSFFLMHLSRKLCVTVTGVTFPMGKCTKDLKKSCHLCIFTKSKGNLINVNVRKINIF